MRRKWEVNIQHGQDDFSNLDKDDHCDGAGYLIENMGDKDLVDTYGIRSTGASYPRADVNPSSTSVELISATSIVKFLVESYLKL